jgi:hypothetical protein
MVEESKHFIEFMKNKIAKDPCDIIKMDQTLIPFSFHSSKKLRTKRLRMSGLLLLTQIHDVLRSCPLCVPEEGVDG